jgi:hypothetical protein
LENSAWISAKSHLATIVQTALQAKIDIDIIKAFADAGTVLQ